MIISRWIFLELEIFQIKVVENVRTRILLSVTFFSKLCRLWDNVENYGTARQAAGDEVIWCMRFTCWITKATDALRICNTYCFSTPTVVTRRRLNGTLYIYCLSFFHIGRTTIKTGRRKRWRGEIEKNDDEEERRTEKEHEERRIRGKIGVKTEREECTDIGIRMVRAGVKVECFPLSYEQQKLLLKQLC
jgi:hypothetical protein